MTTLDPRHALFAGSFNPFTPGHADIVERGLRLFDRITIGIGQNDNKPETADIALTNLKAIQQRYACEPRVNVMIYHTLTIDAAHSIGAGVLLRGVRNSTDYEYESNIADANRLLSPDIETVILTCRPELACISSSLLRELAKYGRSI